MADIAPLATYHYVMGSVKGTNLDKAKYGRPCIGIRQTSFEDGNEIETETDEGHTGVANLDMGSYRTTAESSPQWEDKFRYGEWLEETWYLLLGTVNPNEQGASVTTGVEDTTHSGVFRYSYLMPPDVESELPFATIYNGFAKTETDARVFNNAMLNELEVNFSADEAPTYNSTYVSDYNNFNLNNPTRAFPTESIFGKAPHTQVFVGAVGATEEEMLAVPIDCFSEASFTINNNAESQSCHADEFGKNTKIMGARESEGSITMPWVDGTKLFEPEYEAFNKFGHSVSEEITHKQIWFLVEGGSIQRDSTSNTLAEGETIVREYDVTVEGETVKHYVIDTGVAYKCLMKFPEVELTNVESPKSGDEAKDLTMEFKILEKPDKSFMTVDVTTHLAALHVDTVGTTLAELYANQSVVDGRLKLTSP